jgi:hypothetical protein
VTLWFGFSRIEFTKPLFYRQKQISIWFCLKSNLEKETSLEEQFELNIPFSQNYVLNPIHCVGSSPKPLAKDH